MRKALLIALIAIVAFGIGFVPTELQRRRLVHEKQALELDLRLANLHRQLGVASHEAQRFNYANAATAARAFFDGCRAVTSEYKLEDRPRTRLALNAYAASADEVLGQLANGDPQSRERLASLFLTMQGLLERRQ